MKLIILGAGGRGNVYAGYAIQEGAEIAAVADADRARLNKFAREHHIPDDRLFTSWEEALAGNIAADAVVNAMPNRLHYKPTLRALECGYHVLLEKPIASTEEECIRLVEAAEDKGLQLMVCHVLRYSAFFEKLKEVLDSRVIGEIVNFQLTENMIYWHFVHGFVRGNNRKLSAIGSWILHKSSHDLDLIGYLTGKRCVSVVSEGNLMHFNQANAPEGAPEYCLDGCPHEKTCPHFAPNLYLKQTDNDFPANMISTDMSYKARYEALKSGPYGRCAYQCDNDVIDHQSAIFEMEGGMTATFNIVGFASEGTRSMRIYGTKGDIRAHMGKGEIEVTDFLALTTKIIQVYDGAAGHATGDANLVKDFIEVVKGNRSDAKSSARLSLQSHLMAFAAEKSRIEGRKVFL